MTTGVDARVLVACVGNVFLGDDGFGVEVARRLQATDVPDGVTVVDYGIRSVHLAYDLQLGYDGLVLVDALPQGEPPGTLCVFEPELDRRPAGADVLIDPHSVTTESTLALVSSLPAVPRHVRIVGCEPADTAEGMGLSPAVAAAVDGAVELVHEVVAAVPTEV